MHWDDSGGSSGNVGWHCEALPPSKKNSCFSQHYFIAFNKICENYNVWIKLNGKCESKHNCGYN